MFSLRAGLNIFKQKCIFAAVWHSKKMMVLLLS